MNDSSITIVCCYNSEEQFRKLVTDVTSQTIKVKVLGINNINGQYSSCASALNEATKCVDSEYVIYSHQDISLPQSDTLAKFISYLSQINQNDILGVAGRVRDIHTAITNITTDDSNKYSGGARVNGLMECETLDECFFGGHTSYFKENLFNEEICDDWHLYCVESCLNTRAKGNKVYVCGLHLIHYSSGTLSYKYSEDFRRLAKKYHKYTDRICTTCYEGNTDLFGRNYTFIKYNLSRIIKKLRKRDIE